MKKQRIFSPTTGRQHSRCAGHASLYRSMRCEQLETRCLMHGMPWQITAESESSRNDSSAQFDFETDRSAYIAPASSNSTSGNSSSSNDIDTDGTEAGSSDSLDQQDCRNDAHGFSSSSVNRSSMLKSPKFKPSMSHATLAEGEGDLPTFELAPARTPDGFSHVGGNDRSGVDRNGVSARPAPSEIADRTPTTLDRNFGLTPDNTDKTPPSTNNNLANVGNTSAASGPVGLSPSRFTSPTSLGDLLALLRSNQSGQPGALTSGNSSSGSSPVGGSLLSNSSLGNSSLGNSPLGSSPLGNALSFNAPGTASGNGAGVGIRNPSAFESPAAGNNAALVSLQTASLSTMADGKWQLSSTSNSTSSESLNRSVGTRASDGRSEQTNPLRWSASNNDGESSRFDLSSASLSRQSSASDNDSGSGSAGLLNQLRAQIERLAQQREQDRLNESSENGLRSNRFDSGNETEQSAASSRQALRMLTSQGLLELSNDHRANTEHVDGKANDGAFRDLNAHAAAFASIGLYREFDLLVDASATPMSPTNAMPAAAPVAMMKASSVNASDFKASRNASFKADSSDDSISEPTLTSGMLVPLSFLALGGIIWRRRTKRKSASNPG